MLNKLTIAIFAGFMILTSESVELKLSQNQIKGGELDINMIANGTLTIRHKQHQMLAHLLPNFTTKAKGTWFSFGNPECSPRLTRPNPQTWNFASQIPLNNQKDVLPVKMTITTTPFNTIDISTGWQKPASPKDLSEAGLFITIANQNLINAPLVLDGQSIPVINQSKYGWFEKQTENPQLTLYKGQPGKEFSLVFQGKFHITIATTKDASTVIRFNTKNTDINYTINIK